MDIISIPLGGAVSVKELEIGSIEIDKEAAAYTPVVPSGFQSRH